MTGGKERDGERERETDERDKESRESQSRRNKESP